VPLKQVTIAVGTLMALGLGYVVYTATLGRLTDFPQLSADLRDPMPLDGSSEQSKPTVRESEVAAVRGFGPDCWQVNAPVVFESRRRRVSDPDSPAGRGTGTHIYAGKYEITPDDRKQVVVQPFSLVHIASPAGTSGENDEIITVHASKAVLVVDRPIDYKDFADLDPVAGWVEGEVTLKTNRRTSDPGDDIVMFTDRLHYDLNKRLIWADNAVKIVVEKQGTIMGEGLEVELYPKDGPKEEGKTRRVEAKQARLLKDIRFDLIVSADEDFLGGASAGNREAEAAGGSRDVTVTARGPFVFDLEENVATFQQMVRVLRRSSPVEASSPVGVDQLESDALALRFGTVSADGASAERGELKLEKAVATGQQVILLSESQKLQATGNFLEFDARQRQVTLRGEQEMIAIQDNAVIHAQGLVIEQDDHGQPIRLAAQGPHGWMELGTDQEPPAIGEATPDRFIVRWQDKLTMNRKEESKGFDFQLTGGVELENDKAALTCQELGGLLMPIGDGEGASTGGRNKLEPVKLEAEGNVVFHSDQADVAAETLLMDILNRRPPTAPDAAEPIAKQEIKPTDVLPTPNVDPPKRNDPLASVQVKEKTPADAPIVINARTVAIVIERLGSQSKPVSAWAEGNVRVSQAPKNPGERPFECRGTQLEFQRKPEGDVLVISGTEGSFAEIQSVDMSLAARHRILLNESLNKIEIGGPGYLTIEAGNQLNGEAASQPSPVRVDWHDLMNFDGRIAYFEGAVSAKQEQNEIYAHSLEVTFDKKIDFSDSKAGNRAGGGSKPRVESIFCERDVEAYSQEMRESAVLRRTRIRSQQLRYDNIEHTVVSDGAGSVTVVEPNKPRPDEQGKTVPAEMPYRVTIIEYADRMTGNQSHQTVKFFGSVSIVHTPVLDPSKEVDQDKLPADGMVISAARAEMSQSKDARGRKYRLLNANDNVKIQARDYWATCGRVSYDEQKDMVVMEGERDRPAYFHRQTKPGQPEQVLPARVIRYNLSTQKIETDRSEGFDSLSVGGQNQGPRRR
jgi:lipopolysaccharide export system protein LptA